MNNSRNISLAQNRAASTLLIVFVFFLTVSVYYWMEANAAPPPWDQSWYLETSERLWSALYQGGLPAFFDALSHAFSGTKAPLLSLLPLPFYLLVGHGEFAVILTNISLIVVFCLVLFWLVREMAGPWEALVAVIITNTMPLVFGLSRNFLVEYGLMTLVTLWFFFQGRSDLFRQRKIALGITLGLGMLMKVSFPLFISGPAMLCLYRRWQQQGFKLRNWSRDLGSIGVIASLIASVWYLPNLPRVLKFAFSSGFGPIATNYSYGNPFDLVTILKYWQVVINLGISPYFLALLAANLLILLSFAVFKRWRPLNYCKSSQRDNVGLLFLWLLLPFAVLTLGVNKDYRFIAPALPALGSLIALLLFQAVPWQRFQAVILPLVLLFPLVVFSYMTFPLGRGNIYWADKNWIWLSTNLGYATRPVQERWPLIEIIQTILADASKNGLVSGPSQQPRILLIADHRFFNQNNFSYYTAHLDYPLIFSAVLTKSAKDWPRAREYLLQSQYVLTKTGEQGPDFTTFMDEEIRRMLDKGELPFVEVAKFPLPDGSESVLYRKIQTTSP